jgi:uncharacterized protein (DUF2235 family)
MPKNIILCADGTGNKGGSTPDSNVYKMYKSVNKTFKGAIQEGIEISEQVVFYENGVGTEQNKYLRMLGGGLGFGFKNHVCDLYTFLAKNYEAGDRVYFLGFSRGASTVRACNGFISTCGLIKGAGLRKRELDKRVKKAFSIYKKYKKKPEVARKFSESEDSHGIIDIQFLGIWDTVVALGFPKRTDIIGPISLVLSGLAIFSEKVLDKVWPHGFYNYTLTNNVKHAYQALAIDDERTAFWPFVWNEKGREKDSVEQVWFTGMHSNVGGGYPRSGVSNVALYWMMLRAEKNGLRFEANTIKKALDESHVHGRMYNSRESFSAVYRYHPREIGKLCEGRLEGEIKPHRSVIERMNHRTANYSPGYLPDQFEIVETDIDAPSEFRNPCCQPMWNKMRKNIEQWVLIRKILYEVMLTFVLTITVATFYFNGFQVSPENSETLWTKTAHSLDSILPNFLDGLINYSVIENPIVLVSSVVFVGLYTAIRSWCYSKDIEACEELRHLVIVDGQSNSEKT